MFTAALPTWGDLTGYGVGAGDADARLEYLRKQTLQKGGWKLVSGEEMLVYFVIWL